MSRAFVREGDGDSPDDLPELPLSPHPNYVTPRGLRLLQERLRAVEQQRTSIDDAELGAVQQRALLAREARWLRARIGTALLLPTPAQPPALVVFGAVVELLDDAGKEWRYQIVGEDEADPEQGYISWLSPLARAIEGRPVGDEVKWPRPAGDLMVEILAIRTGA